MDGDLSIGTGDVRVRITGLTKTVTALRKSGTDMQDMSELMHAIGTTVVHIARPKAPYLSGALARTVRAGRGKTKAVIRAGTAAVPYAGVQHYGWPARGIRPHPFLVDALTLARPRVLDQLDQGLAQILRKNHLT
ncbi:hypothetical protein [Curtobacterium sp. PhB146]|uniref:hypothetical protein n=1 Tax=Curtobacterium sp. PhB146 TaxID=2485187 RepID=UPI0010E4836D|nr:hypothetical protein [Curtobacterium sp. PhB146]TCU48345.1 hypothetical protein EDF33_102236 [Curtobacterium sp. PhB146]